MNQPMYKALGAGILALLLMLPGCTSPLQAPPTGKVVIPTPYGKRVLPAQSGYFQSTVVPQNLETLVDHFRVYLRGTGGLADRPSFTLPFGEAAEFVFDGVPPGTYDLDVLAFQSADETGFDIDAVDSYNNGSVIARGRLNGIVVNNGGVTVTDLVTVSPITRDHGTFSLTIRGIPADVTGFSLDYKIVFVNNDGSLSIQPFGGPDTDSNGTLDYIETSSLPDYLETVGSGLETDDTDSTKLQLTLKTNHSFAIQAGTFFLQVKFKGSEGLYNSFQPIFTIQVFKNLNSVLDVALDKTWLGQPLAGSESAAPANLTTATDGSLGVTVGWGRTNSPNYVSHYQIAWTADPDSNGPPTDAEILATVPNVNGVAAWPTGIQLQDPALPKAKFWVRKIYSGMRASAWGSVTAGLGSVGGVTTSLPQVTISGPVSTTAAQPVATFSATASFVSASSVWVVDGQTVQTNSSSSIDSLVLDTSNLSAGSHQILLKATDSLGVTYSSSPYTLKVRSLPTDKVAFSRYSSSSYWLRPDGTLWAWGLNNLGQLGDGTTTGRLSPVWIANNVVDVSAGASHVLVAKTDGSLWVSGDNSYGQWGNGTTSGGGNTLTKVISGGVIAVAAQVSGSFALKADGTLWSAGNNYNGALGRIAGGTDTTWTQVATDVKEVQAGDFDAFALMTDGTLWSTGWDVGGMGQLGLTGHPTFVSSFTAVDLTGTVTSFSVGRFDSFVVKNDGTLWAVGNNQNKNQGLASGNFITFQQVPGVTGVKAVSAGGYHTVIVMNDGTARTAGYNSNGELGLGTTTGDQAAFQPVPGLTGVQAATAGYQTTSFITTSGLFVAGSNVYGEVGDGTTITQSVPQKVSSFPPSLKIFSGQYRNFVIKPDGTLWAAGDDVTGQLGDGFTTSLDTFTQVMAGSTFTQVSAGDDHTLFLKTDGSVWGVGKNASGELGDGTTVDRFSPIEILPAGSAKAVAAGHDFSLILKADGTVLAAGQNVGGALGQGDTNDLVTFTSVPLVSGVVAISAGDDFSLLLKADGTLLTAGVASTNYHNQVGDPGAPGPTWVAHNSFAPVLSGVAQISAGQQFATVVKNDGSLWVAGFNSNGQLGTGALADADAGFVQVMAKGVESVAAGIAHTLVKMKNGTLWGMGYGSAVGSGSDQPTAVLIDSSVRSMAAGGYHTYFTRDDGSLWWIGADNYDVNGITGNQGTQPIPQRVF